MADVTLDRRQNIDNKVFRIPKTKLSFLATDTEKTFTMLCNGLLHTAIMEVPSFPGALTATMTIIDGDEYEMFNSAAKDVGNTYVMTNTTTLVPLQGIVTVKVALDAPAGAGGGDVNIVIYFT